jgi:hypothetical protein
MAIPRNVPMNRCVFFVEESDEQWFLNLPHVHFSLWSMCKLFDQAFDMIYRCVGIARVFGLYLLPFGYLL